MEEWEKFVGIPEGCFDLEFTDLERRINILIKLGYLNLQVEQDYRDLADILNVEIVSFDNSVYGTITITIVDLVPDTFDLLFDPVLNPTYGAFIFGSKTDTLYQCLIQTYKPAFINVVFVEQQQ
ncbi:hypothetical protein IB691_01640 [Fangia hongkongensis]|nr:hypothetical protein [Fangia hongkongensis]